MANLNISQLQELTRRAGWPESLVEKMSAIWKYESGGNPSAHNPNGEDSWGLSQVNRPYHSQYTLTELINPLRNLQIAYQIYKIEGINAWFNSNKKYLQDYQGIATEAKTVYNGHTVITEANVPGLLAAANNNTTTNNDKFIYYGIAAAVIIFLLK